MDSRALDLVVTGHVQGVFYRAGLREQAGRLGLAGWARNEPDGTVRAHVEGPSDAFPELLEWCEIGSPMARVDEVRQHEAEVQGLSSFEVE